MSRLHYESPSRLEKQYVAMNESRCSSPLCPDDDGIKGWRPFAEERMARWRAAPRRFTAIALILATTVMLTVLAFTPYSRPLMSAIPRLSSPLLAPFRWHAANGVTVEGSPWAHELYDSLLPTCPDTPANRKRDSSRTTKMYDGDWGIPRTALATYPRSGNTFTRMLVERATGYRTTSVYCDRTLEQTFLGECAGQDVDGSEFLSKTHYPAVFGETLPDAMPETYMGWDRAVRIVRNPIDAVFSYWHWESSPANGTNRHEWRGNIDGGLGATPEQMEEITKLAVLWRDFHEFWDQAPIPRVTIRYEDMRRTPLSSVLSIVSFLLPSAIRPSLSSIACSLTLDPSREAYASKKSPLFSTWDLWTEEARKKVLEITRQGWCRYGYDQDVHAILGDEVVTGIDCQVAAKERVAELRQTLAPPPSGI